MSVLAGSPVVDKLALLRLMMESREGDRREAILLRQSKGWFQIGGMGHEALAALALPLREDDWLFPYYRDRALMLARGLTTPELALTYFAKRDSLTAGRQMPGHYNSAKHNVFSVCTPTGGHLLPAAGVAWAMKLQGKDTVVLASTGDAATRQGEFYEAFAFAVQEDLPVIFVVEDNKFGISTPTLKFLAFNLGGILHDEHLVQVDGRQPDAVFGAMTAAVEKARSGRGPTMLWCDIDRLGSHTSSDDHRVYRSPEDILAMMERDPLSLLKTELIEQGIITDEDYAAMQGEIVQFVDNAYREAEKAVDPAPEDLMVESWGPDTPAVTPPIEAGNLTMVEAINKTFNKALEDDPSVIFFGEDIEDPKGGVFGLTKGLSTKFPRQVFNSPLAEATVVGVAVGMAAYGMKPVFEIQFIDFIAPAWNQITANVSTLRWRTFGDWKCPLVLYAPYGAYLPGGSLWHSQANEGMLAHNPGIKLAVPSTPEDAAGLFWAAIHGEDPTIILVPKHIFRKRAAVDKAEPVPFGSAKVLQEGTDVTVVAWGNTLELAHEAAEKLAGEVSLEIIDLRTLVPCDFPAIAKSLEKTGRLVVIQEDVKTCSFGQTIISEMTSDPATFNTFLASPQLVTRDDVHIGYNPIYEYAALPDLKRVIDAIRVTME